MKTFIIQSLLFVSLCLGIFGLILMQADGHTDTLYLKFTSPKQQHLILGNSKAAQGLQPNILAEVSGIDFYNYAFSLDHSPYGPVYLHSIKKKLQQSEKPAHFILSLDPWSISSISSDPNDSTSFRELNYALNNTHFVNLNPNFEYLLKNLNGKYHSILTQRNPEFFLHSNGWLEVQLDMEPGKVAERIEAKVKKYQEENLPNFRFSSFRMHYLKKTIDFLKQQGKVYLIRLPVHPKIKQLEDESMPDFEEKIASLSDDIDGYLDLSPFNQDYQYIDGTHLDVASSARLSKTVAEWLREIQHD